MSDDIGEVVFLAILAHVTWLRVQPLDQGFSTFSSMWPT